MSDKKRRARIQSGWASSKKSSEEKPCKNTNRQQGEAFHFNPTVEIKTKPAEIVIKDDGFHELSTTRNGSSRVILQTQFVEAQECEWMFEQLLCEVPWKKESIFIKGEKILQPRLTAWFGDESYTYSGLTLKPYQFSPLLTLLKDRIEAFLKDCVSFNSLLANLYNNEKDSIDWHSDDEVSLGRNPVIASLSFGETRTFEMRKKNEDLGNDYDYAQHVKLPLPNGSLLVMDGATQTDWQHRVPKEYHDRKARINLTFRTIHSAVK